MKTRFFDTWLTLAERLGLPVRKFISPNSLIVIQEMPPAAAPLYMKDLEEGTIETALVFDTSGKTIAFHAPLDRTAGSIPDSRSLWDLLWENRHILGGVAHTHPWPGSPWYSQTDVTTFAAVETALGVRLVWAVVTADQVGYYQWTGPARLDYDQIDILLSAKPFCVEGIEELRRLSGCSKGE